MLENVNLQHLLRPWNRGEDHTKRKREKKEQRQQGTVQDIIIHVNPCTVLKKMLLPLN